jgi:hypothetical protein
MQEAYLLIPLPHRTKLSNENLLFSFSHFCGPVMSVYMVTYYLYSFGLYCMILQIYSEEDRLKMPLELANALSHEREAVDDSEIRERALEAIYMIVMQVSLRYPKGNGLCFTLLLVNICCFGHGHSP